MKNLLFTLALLGGSALATPTAIIHTSMGDITVELDEDRAPATVGSIAMARTSNPHSATSQFFINLVDNEALNPGGADAYGYAVFGKVVSGMSTVDAIAKVKTGARPPYADVPEKTVTIQTVEILPEPKEEKAK